ncbi:MAG: twitching motility protein PilT [Verrucomicrobiaceae bacterium]|nr:twitching motility protein PilT [Verrucomicrobiaceae bacterium]
MTYADTGFLISLSISEDTSAQAVATMASVAGAVSVIWLTELEFENAVLRAVFQKRITPQLASTLMAEFENDVARGVYSRSVMDCNALSTEASRLAQHFTPAIGTRTLDLLHVAAANMLQCQTFLSFDDRQRRTAAALGMKVLPA